MTMVQNAVVLLKQAFLGLDPGHPLHSSVNKAIGDLTKHAASGQPAAGAQMTQLQDLMRGVGRSAMLQQLAGQQGGQRQRGGPPNMPSTPLPGA